MKILLEYNASPEARDLVKLDFLPMSTVDDCNLIRQLVVPLFFNLFQLRTNQLLFILQLAKDMSLL